MTPEKVFAFARAYQLYYKGQFDFSKYRGHLPTPPLIQQKDRQFYYRIAHRLDDAAVHALFTLAYFHNPKAYISELVSAEKFSAAVTFASRTQNGRPLLEAELWELTKRFSMNTAGLPDYGNPGYREFQNIREWLYANAMPECVQDIISHELPLDIASLLLLIPQPVLRYNWVAYWSQHPDASLGLGAQPWIDRLKKADQLIFAQRDGWRNLSHALAAEFWASVGLADLSPIPKNQTELFT